MAKIDTGALMFDAETVKKTSSLLPRLVRTAFYGLGITNEGYLARYYHDYQGKNPLRSRKEFSQKAAADRKVLMEPRKITFNMAEGILSAMGYSIESVQFTLRDRLLGETKTFSTDMTIDEIDAMISRDNEVGIGSIS